MTALRNILLFALYAMLLAMRADAQQFIGLNTTKFSAIQHMATNPAWVAAASNGNELMLFSVSALAGTNTFSISKKFVFEGFGGAGKEGKGGAYLRNPELGYKHLWANIEYNGPAFSCKYNDEHFFGIFTRARQIFRAGNINSSALQILGQKVDEDFYGAPVGFRKAGFSTHTFAEVGVSYGRILHNDYYHLVRGGVSVKYLMGFVGGSIYTNDLGFTTENEDSISLKGDLNLAYTHNIGAFVDNNVQNDLTSWFTRAGRGGLGLDIGAQYEYHPEGNPNRPTPYVFSISASLTDLGSIGYIADTGSGSYELNISNKYDTSISKISYEGINDYMMRMERDSITGKSEKIEKFRMGLPTAFRLSADYNVSEKMNFAVNMLLNLRGNTRDIYRPAYVNYINMTATFGGKNFNVGLPFTVIGYQTFAIGAIVRAGPFYIGSTGALGMLMTKRLSNIDAYAGFVWKFRRDVYRY